MSQNKRDFILTFEKKVFKETKITKKAKSQFLGAKQRNLPKSRGTSWQSNDYCLEDRFPSTYQISCDSDSIVQIISTSVFLPYAISKALESLGRPWWFVLHHLISHLFMSFYSNVSQVRWWRVSWGLSSGFIFHHVT